MPLPPPRGDVKVIAMLPIRFIGPAPAFYEQLKRLFLLFSSAAALFSDIDRIVFRLRYNKVRDLCAFLEKKKKKNSLKI